jgi:hypothetical protein
VGRDLECFWPSRRPHAYDESVTDTAPVPYPFPWNGRSVSENSEVQAARRTSLNEDWLATIVGLVLLLLVLFGAIPGWLIP